MAVSFAMNSSIAGLVALLALACAPGPSSPGPEAAPPARAPEPSQAAPPGQAASQRPQRGGVLQWTPIKSEISLHPHKGGAANIKRLVGPGYETLVSFRYEPGKDYRATFEVIPWLAEGWRQLDDQTYLFTIRKGVKWHDGVEFTAADAAFTYQWLRQEKFAAAGRVAQAESFEALDPYTLKIAMKKATPDFIQSLADTNLLIVPKHVVERGDELSKVLVGTGAFKLKSYRSGVASVWERNESYWQPGRPYPDGVRQVWGLEESAIGAAFIAGENDLLASGDATVIESLLKARPEAKQVPRGSDTGTAMYMKLDRPPFNDARVRRALHLTLDREAMHRTLVRGVPVESAQYVTPGVWAGKDGWALPQEELRRLPGYRTPKEQDVAEAKRLLAEAGYPQGLAFEIMYDRASANIIRRAEMLPDLLKPAGFAAGLKPMESAALAAADASGQWEGGNIQTGVDSQFGNLHERLHSAGVFNRLGLNDPKLDALIEGTLAGADVGARKRTARQLQEYLLEQVYYLPTIEISSAALTQPWVYDISNNSSSMSPTQDTYPQVWLDAQTMPSGRR